MHKVVCVTRDIISDWFAVLRRYRAPFRATQMAFLSVSDPVCVVRCSRSLRVAAAAVSAIPATMDLHNHSLERLCRDDTRHMRPTRFYRGFSGRKLASAHVFGFSQLEALHLRFQLRSRATDHTPGMMVHASMRMTRSCWRSVAAWRTSMLRP